MKFVHSAERADADCVVKAIFIWKALEFLNSDGLVHEKCCDFVLTHIYAQIYNCKTHFQVQ